jgi:hypothetical protein
MTTDLVLLAIQNIIMALLVGHCPPIRRIAFQLLRLCHNLLLGSISPDRLASLIWLEWEAKNTRYHVSYQGNQKRKCLIESMYGEKIMVISPLLK